MYEIVLQRLEAARNPAALAGMARYGITPARAYGVKIPVLRQLAREVRSKDKAARWVARDALKELRGTAVQKRLKK